MSAAQPARFFTVNVPEPWLRIPRVMAWVLLSLTILVPGVVLQWGSLPYTLDWFAPANTGAPADDSAMAAMAIAGGAVGLTLLSAFDAGPAVGRLRVHQRPVGAWVGTVGLAVVIALGVSVFVGTELATALAGVVPATWERGDPGGTFRSTPMVLQWFASLSAGILEEFSYVVAPIAGWCGAIAAIDRRRERQHQHPVSLRVYRVGIVMLVAVGMLLRFNLHTYQGLLPALLALGWSGVNIVVFLWSRSLLALVVAHTLFDALFAGSIGLGIGYAGTGWIALGAAAAASVTAALLTRRQRQCPGKSSIGAAARAA